METIIFQPKIRSSPIHIINGERNNMGGKKLISPYIPKTLHELGVEDFFDELPRMAHFIWMISWVWNILLGWRSLIFIIPLTLRRPLDNNKVSTYTFHFLMTRAIWFCILGRNHWGTNLLYIILRSGGDY